VENDYVRFAFNSSNGGLYSLIDKTSGLQHINTTQQDATIWNINFYNGGSISNQLYQLYSNSVQTLADGTVSAEMIWNVSQYSLTVKVTVLLPNDSGIATFNISVKDDLQQTEINDIDFPRINGFLESGQYDIALPQDSWGRLFKNCTWQYYGAYPDGWSMSMQFLCAIRGGSGVYIGAHDRRAMFKSFNGVPGQYFILNTMVENAGVKGAGFDAPFPVKLGVYQGDWMDGCKIYRKFALTAPWTSENKISQRTSMPQQLKDIGLWMRFGDTVCSPETPTATRNALLYKAQTYFNVPLGVHWYFWHNNKFDYDLPNYFPAKPGYPEQFADMVSRGWIVMPYINSRVVDQNNFNEYQNYICINKHGNPYIEKYGEKSDVNNHPVCTYTNYWQDKINTISQTLVSSEIGANAIYHDQLAGSHPAPCFNPSHNHPLGGGGHWVDGYRRMLHKIRETAAQSGKEIVQCGEFTAEPYMDGLDAFLAWSIGFDGQNIPMMSAVYSGYTLYIGSNAYFGWTDQAWRMYVGRCFIWGAQCGWMSPEELFAVGNEKKLQFLRQVGYIRVQARKFLTYGELSEVLDSSQTITDYWTLDVNKPKMITLPAVQGSVWKAEDGTAGILLVNYTIDPQNINFNIDLNSYFEPQTKAVMIYKISNRGTQLIGIYPKEIHTFNENLPSTEIRYLEIKPFNADVNGDRKVDRKDLSVIAENWLEGI
jgi:hypothetical protein